MWTFGQYDEETKKLTQPEKVEQQRHENPQTTKPKIVEKPQQRAAKKKTEAKPIRKERKKINRNRWRFSIQWLRVKGSRLNRRSPTVIRL